MSNAPFESSHDGLDTYMLDQMGMGPAGSLAGLLGKGSLLLPKGNVPAAGGLGDSMLNLGATDTSSAPSNSMLAGGAVGQPGQQEDDDNASFIEMGEAGDEGQEAAHAEEGQQEQEQEPEQPLTVTLAMGISAMDASLSSIEQKVRAGSHLHMHIAWSVLQLRYRHGLSMHCHLCMECLLWHKPA